MGILSEREAPVPHVRRTAGLEVVESKYSERAGAGYPKLLRLSRAQIRRTY